MTIKHENHKYFGCITYKEYKEKEFGLVDTAIEQYIEEFRSKKYRYTIWHIERKLDLKKQFVQRNLIPYMETLFVTKPVKDIIKDCVFMPELLTPDIRLKSLFGYRGELSSVFSLFSSSLLISEKSFKDMIKDVVYRVEIDKDGDEIILEISDDEVNQIMKDKLFSNNTLRSIFGLEHDTQIYRKLNALLCEKKIVKYAIIPYGSLSDRKLMRYLILDKTLIED